MNTFSERLRWAMKAASASSADLANAAGIKPPSVSHLLNGNPTSLKAETALRASRRLHIDPWWLVFGEGSPTAVERPSESASASSLVTDLAAIVQPLPKLHRQILAEQVAAQLLNGVNPEAQELIDKLAPTPLPKRPSNSSSWMDAATRLASGLREQGREVSIETFILMLDAVLKDASHSDGDAAVTSETKAATA